MTESVFTQNLLHRLRAALPAGIVPKISDNYTVGMPDFCCSLGGRTCWYEIKLTTNRRWYEPIQRETLIRFHGSYIIFNPIAKRAALFPASQVSKMVTMGTPDGFAFSFTLDELVAIIVKELKSMHVTGGK